jgi:hypothetical protein
MGNRGTCSNCGRPIFRNSPGGDWYHTRTIATACYPGSAGRKNASPVEVDR